jgi:hypothetical protein
MLVRMRLAKLIGFRRAYATDLKPVGRPAVDHYFSFANGAPWFVGWGTLALINAALAQGKNRSGLLWFLVSLIFGPLCTLLLVVMPKVRSKLF